VRDRRVLRISAVTARAAKIDPHFVALTDLGTRFGAHRAQLRGVEGGVRLQAHDWLPDSGQLGRAALCRVDNAKRRGLAAPAKGDPNYKVTPN
jgi:hypothetical protein